MTTKPSIEWLSNEGGVVTIGGSRRGIIFGQFGPAHECEVPSFEISSKAFSQHEIKNLFSEDTPVEELLRTSHLRLPTEGEWELAFQQKQISSVDGIEALIDHVPERGYWGQPTDGRPKGPRGFQIIRDWRNSKEGRPKTGLLFEDNQSVSFRLVREVPKAMSRDGDGDPLPTGPEPVRRAIEELLIAILLGILPSFIWAFFNARPGYIQEGWPGLVLGGLFISAFSAIFWRPSYPEFKKDDKNS